MYDRLTGEVVRRTPTELVLETAGVGWALRVPVSTSEALPASGTATVLVRLVVRDDAHTLYGFTTEAERTAFDRLTGISGVGPGTALAILSGGSVDQLARMVEGGDADGLRSIKGVGPKTAARIITELTGEPLVARDDAAPAAEADDEAVAALVSLGHSRKEATGRVRRAREAAGADAPVPEVVRAALRG